jgi:toxin ParE1/3/4
MFSSGCAGGTQEKSEPPNVAFEVHFRPEAEADLIGLYEYIAEVAGTRIAGRYIDRIEAACMALADFPKRGTRRDDIRPGLRTIGFERRAPIVYRVLPARVEIVAIAYGGRNFEADLDEW